jgi:hypothetical protein
MEYQVGYGAVWGAWFSSVDAACNGSDAVVVALGAAVWGYRVEKVVARSCTPYSATFGVNGTYLSNGQKLTNGHMAMSMRTRTAECPVGWYVTPAGCVQTPPPKTVTQQEVEDAMAPRPIPPGLPQEIPGVPLPIEIPIINPTPGPNPKPQPLWIPQGNPVPNPNTDPRTYTQPGTRVTPAPTTESPWQVDVQPEGRESTDPEGVKEPITDPAPVDPDAPKETPDLCEKYPDILACQKLELDTPDGEIPRDERQIEFKEQSFFGSGSCPVSQTVNTRILGTVTPWDWAKACEHLLITRALVMVLATFAAFLIVLPGKEVRT